MNEQHTKLDVRTAHAREEKPTTLPEWVRGHVDLITGWSAISTNNDPGCLVVQCDRNHFAVGLCKGHYRRAQLAFGAAVKGCDT